MIDLKEFFALKGMNLQVWAMDYIPCSDEELLDKLLSRIDDLDMDHFRVMLALFAKYDSERLRKVIMEYKDSDDLAQDAAVQAFYENQRRCGYIE